MALAIMKNGAWARWDGWLGDAQHNTLDVERCWSPAELAAAGLAIIQPAVIPAGQVAIGQPSLADEGGVPREVYQLEDEPLRPLSPRQIRLGLIAHGIALASVDSAIEALESPQDRAAARVEWEYAPEFRRDHALIDQIGAELGLSSAQIDAMWRAAMAL